MGEHAAYLELAAHCDGATDLADRIANWDLIRPWSACWAQWRPTTPHRLLGRHRGMVNAVAMAELEGRSVVVTGGDDGVVRVWDLATGAPVGDTQTGHEGAVNALALAELDGRLLVVSGGEDGTVRVWELSGAPRGRVARLAPHRRRRPSMRTLLSLGNPVYTVALTRSRGGPSVVCNYGDGIVGMFDLRTGAADWTIDFDSSITSLALRPESTLVVAGSQGVMALEYDRGRMTRPNSEPR